MEILRKFNLKEKSAIFVILGWCFMFLLFVPSVKGYLFLLVMVASGLFFCLSIYYDAKLMQNRKEKSSKNSRIKQNA